LIFDCFELLSIDFELVLLQRYILFRIIGWRFYYYHTFMKHSHITVSLWLLVLSFTFMTTVLADSTNSTTNGSVMTGVVDTGIKSEQRHEDRLTMIETIRQNWKDAIDENWSDTKALLDASDSIRQEATSACKAAVDQFKAGTLTKDAALTQCKELKKKMEGTIRTMRRDLQAVRKANRDTTKTTNQSLRKDFREQYGLWTGVVWSWNRKPEMKPKEEMSKRPEMKPGTGNTIWSWDMRPPRKDDDRMWTGSMGSGDRREWDMKREPRLWTGNVMWSWDMRPPIPASGDIMTMIQSLGKDSKQPKWDRKPEMKPKEEEKKDDKSVDWVPPVV
jgi:hypothetical protein